MLQIHNIAKHYGPQLLFEDISLQMGQGERLGLMGRNGHGKTTLFRMILGEIASDHGHIQIPKHYKIGCIKQHLQFSEPNVLTEGCLALPEDEKENEYQVEKILFGLGFDKEDMIVSPGKLSGGFQVRLNLAKLLISKPNLLLLDEPTNYLDIVSIRWVVNFLRRWQDELIVISHDRDFMDQVTTHTALIHRHALKKIRGGSEKLYAQIDEEELLYEKTRKNEDKKRKHMEKFVDRFKAKASKATAAKSRMKMLEKMDKKEALSDIKDLAFQFHYDHISSKNFAKLNQIAFHYKEENPLFWDLNFSILKGERIGVIGKNGKGKSTFLKLLAGEVEPKFGSIKKNENLKIGYFGQTNIDRLNPNLTVEDEITSANITLGRTAVRNICGTMMFTGDLADKKVSVLSGGEKSRVMLGKIIAAPANLLLLDEPTNHLDIQSIDSLIEAVKDFAGSVAIVTHSEAILRKFATKLLVFNRGNATLFDGNYDEFLKKIGWDDNLEGQLDDQLKQRPDYLEKIEQAAVKEKISKKESRQKRAEYVQKKSKLIKPLEEKIAHLESEISTLESGLEEMNLELTNHSKNKNIDAFVQLSKKKKETQSEVELLYNKMEKLDKQLQAKKLELENH